MWLDKVLAELGEEVKPNWRYFSLNQNNHPDKDTWAIWDQPKTDPNWENEKIAPSLYYFWSAEAARRQGEAAFWRFHLALLTAKHEEPKQNLYKREEIVALAESAELDMVQFKADFNDPTCLERLAQDHQHSQSLDVFGTPTFVFGEAKPMYLKLDRVLSTAEALDFWGAFTNITIDKPYLQELKRP